MYIDIHYTEQAEEYIILNNYNVLLEKNKY